MMATAEDPPPAGVVANWVTSQKGTPLLRDDNNFNYRIHLKNKEGTLANYRCVKRYKANCPAVAVLHIASSRTQS